MRKIYLLFSPLIFVGVAACNSPVQKMGSVPDTVSKPEPDTIRRVFETHKVQRFSDSTEMDTFQIEVKGDDLLSGKAELRITRFDGSVIFQEFFAAKNLLGTQLVPAGQDGTVISDSEKTAFLTSRLNAFFTPENFVIPATNVNPKKTGTRKPDEAFWNRLKNDQTSVGFVFVQGNGKSSWLAFDRETGTVKPYYSSF
ncbi:MAG: hypothetical protein INR69_13265 [Mucilaginibacter polytrichastri]|nr:hypothetical protein [Mucilaginibacter polytrichastri]